MRKRDPELNEDRRKTIVKTASRCFVKNGFHGTSMKDVCIAVGMSPGTLYHYYSSKTEIIAAIIANDAELLREVFAQLHETPVFLDALFEILEVIAKEISDAELALHTEIASEVLRQPQLRKQQRASDRETLALVTQSIMRAQNNGEIDQNLNAEQTAKLVFATIDGLLWRATLEGVGQLKTYLPAVKQALARMLLPPEKSS